MKDFLIKRGQILMSLIPIINTILLLAIFGVALHNADNTQKIKKNVECSYFINVAEYSNGSVEYFCTVSDYHSAKQIELEFKRQIQAQTVGTCQYGNCLDSSEITLFRDCSENYDIEIYRDTTLIHNTK